MYWVVVTLQADCMLEVLARDGYVNGPIGSKVAVLVICMVSIVVLNKDMQIFFF